MEKKTIFDLYNEQHANDPIIKASDELPGIVKPEDVKPEVIPGEEKAASSLAAGTVESAAGPAQPEPVSADQVQESEDLNIQEGGTNNV